MSAEMGDRRTGPVLDAHRFDEAGLAGYLTDRLPGFAGPLTVHQFRGGQSNPTFLLETPDGTYVLRKKPPGDLLPSAHAVDREFRVISGLQESDVPVPVPHLLCEDASVIGQMFYVMSDVPGRIITTREMPGCAPMNGGGSMRTWSGCSPACMRSTSRPPAWKILAAAGYVARQVARWSRQYEASKVEDCPAMDRLIAWLPENAPDDDRASLVHGDYRLGNMVVDPEKPEIAAVLDWELSTIGHPYADLGYFCMVYRLPREATSHGLLDLDLGELGIPAEEKVLESYCRHAGLSHLPDHDYYVIFSMFRLAAILAGVLRRGLDGNASDPQAVERGRTYSLIAERAWDIAGR